MNGAEAGDEVDYENDCGAVIGDSVQGYRLVRCLEEGGFFVGFHWIYEAVDDGGRHVAIKLLGRAYAEQSDKFLRSARFMQQLNHAGVARVLDVTQHPAGMACAILERLSGETLERRIQRAGRMSPAAAKDITRQLAQCLCRIHEAGAVYLGLGPESTLLVRGAQHDASLRTKLMGFTSVLLPGEELKSHGTLSSPRHYVSPEVCEGKRAIDGKADVYSLGALLYELLSGRPPFYDRHTTVEILMCHLYTPVPPLDAELPAVPAPLLRLMYKMLSKDPAERPAMRQVVDALK